VSPVARGLGPRLALLGALGVGLIGTGYVATRRVERQLEAGKICGAVRTGDWAAALAHGERATGADPDGRIAAECLCWAYAASERLDDCVALLERILAEPAGADWVPDPALARMLLRKELEVGKHEAAARLAARASAEHPADAGLLELELLSRGAIEGELEVLRQLRARLRGDVDDTLAARLVIASGYERQGEFEAALEVLGDEPPRRDPDALRAWCLRRAWSIGGLGRGDELRALFARWRELGGDEYELRARYAVSLSMHALEDPQRPRDDLLWQAMLDEEHLEDQELRRTVYERLIGGLLVSQRIGEALWVYDRALGHFDHLLISREEILRTANASRLATLGAKPEKSEIEFRLPADAAPGEIWLSAGLDRPPDAAYERLPIRSGRARARRLPGEFPFRWVYRDAQGRALASGSTWADLANTEIDVRPSSVNPPPAFEAPVQAPPDGRRRVFALIPDCGDWRIIQYLLARGELPMHAWLLERGQRAVLESSPAFTGAAMESLVWPRKQVRTTFVGQVNLLGLELAGLASIGRNPFGFLGPVLPESESLFERVGAGERVALNLLFSHAQVDAGRHAERIGPRGARSRLQHIQAARPLRADEATELPAGLRVNPFVPEVYKMAAELDAAVEIARAGEVDLLVLRIEPLDIITHGFFSELMRPAQDDGQATLLWAYRYIDRRLREVWQALDADDVLVVFSDHGIRTAIEHDEDAFLVAAGAGIPHGRIPGQPHLRGVPALLAELLGVPADWPDTGLVAGLAGAQRAASRP
jgi:hypothetical protein